MTTDTTTRPDATHAQGHRHAVERTVRRQGFRAVDPPTLAPAARYADHYPDDELLRAVPTTGEAPGDGPVLAPEVTLPLARTVAERDDAGRGRATGLLATGPCWRVGGSRSDGRREFRRTGIALFGADRPTADAEVLSATVTALAACGVGRADVSVRVSHRGLLGAVFEAFGGEVDVPAAVAATAAHDPDAEAYREALVDARLNYGQADTGAELLGLGAGGLDALADLTGSAAVRAAVDDLRAVLDATDVADWLDVSLPAAPARDYYTGTTVTVVDPERGDRIARGGRFDDLVAALGGEPCPAVGVEIDHPALGRLCEATGGGPHDGPERPAAEQSG